MSAFADLPLVIEPAELASRLHAPELILVDLTGAERYAQGHIPGARCVEIRGAGHAPFLSHPDAFDRALGAFLDGC